MKKIFSLIMALTMLCSFALAEVGLTDFNTYDMNMNPVDESIFADYDLTMVNIWATWCGYCIQEMPELVKLYEMLPDNVNLITICDDASTEVELTYAILDACRANFQTLIANQEMYDQFLNQVYAFPTTYFLDSNGMPVGEPITGLPSLDDAAETYYSIINEVLKSMEE